MKIGEGARGHGDKRWREVTCWHGDTLSRGETALKGRPETGELAGAYGRGFRLVRPRMTGPVIPTMQSLCSGLTANRYPLTAKVHVILLCHYTASSLPRFRVLAG